MSADLSAVLANGREEPALNVIEAFGPTVQGEGPDAGKYAAFLRLASCNLDCSWCDTRYSWDWIAYNPRKEIKRCSVRALAELPLFREHGVPRLVITGGEPMMQQRRLAPFVHALTTDAPIDFVEIETNGTITPDEETTWQFDSAPAVVRYNVSPKLAHSGIDVQRRINMRSLVELRRAGLGAPTIFKFVVAEPSDGAQIAAIVNSVGCQPADVWLMPEGETSERLNATLPIAAAIALDNGWNVCDRLHVRAWGAERGR